MSLEGRMERDELLKANGGLSVLGCTGVECRLGNRLGEDERSKVGDCCCWLSS